MKLDSVGSLKIRAVHRLFRDPEGRRFLIFLMVGGLNTLVGYCFFVALTYAGLGKTLAVVGATALGVLFNFFSTGRIVFDSGNLSLLPRFIGVYIVQCAANILLLNALTALGVHLLVAEAIILSALAVGTFFAMRRFVFNVAAKS
jgi:putative flippase GtrA